MKHLFIVNPTAGSKDKTEYVRKCAEEALKGCTDEYEVYVTKAPLDATRKIQEDAKLYDYMRALWDSEGIFIEPSSCAAYAVPEKLFGTDTGWNYCKARNIPLQNATHIVWATGGRLVPEDIREAYRNTYL